MALAVSSMRNAVNDIEDAINEVLAARDQLADPKLSVELDSLLADLEYAVQRILRILDVCVQDVLNPKENSHA